MRTGISFLVCSLLSFILLPSVNGQSNVQDTSSVKSSPDYILKNYFDQVGENLFLNNGREYIRDGRKTNGIPYFETAELTRGSVSYDGRLYDNVDLLYDMTAEKLITNNYQRNGLMELVPEKIENFSIGTHRFVRLVSNSSNQNVLKDGNYEILYSGRVSLFSHTIKKLELQARADENVKFLQTITYLIQKNNKYYEVHDEKEVLKLFQDKSDEMNKYLRSNHIKMRKNLKGGLIQVTEHYSQL